jgi:undecaprenyl phosphate N,N'-diacetylbacillosamine 1-phosphate transferase
MKDGLPFFLQKRAGKNGRIFQIIKFRTMNSRMDEDGKLLPDKDRLTSIGKILRKFSLDEIPQMVNVLKGDMAIIGPRPLLPQYLPLYSKEQARRHEVRPGITGWAQINGRNTLKFSDRFKYDVWYVDNFGFRLDLKIFIWSIRNVLTSHGVINGQNINEIDDLNFNKGL